MISRFRYRILSILGGLPVLTLIFFVFGITLLNVFKDAELGILLVFGSLITLTLYGIPILLTILFFLGYRIDVAKNNNTRFSSKDLFIEAMGLVLGIVVAAFGLFVLSQVTVGKYAQLFFSIEQIKLNTPFVLVAFPVYIFLSSYSGVKLIQYLARRFFKKLLLLIFIMAVVFSPFIVSTRLYYSSVKTDTEVLSGFELSNFKVERIYVERANFGGQYTKMDISADLESPTDLNVIIQPYITYPYMDSKISSALGGTTKDVVTKVVKGKQRIIMNFGTGTTCMSDDYKLIESGQVPQTTLNVTGLIQPQGTVISKEYPLNLLTIKDIYQHCPIK